MPRDFNYFWRLFGTGFSFSMFGLGGLILGFAIFPAVHLFSLSRGRAKRRCRYLVHLSFRLFIWLVSTLGVISYNVKGRENIDDEGSNIFVANHPSLIDVVFIVSLLPEALCVVKKAAWSNPFMAGIMWGAGYIRNDEPEKFISDCVSALKENKKIVIFPEGTRSVPGRPMKLLRGAASIIAESEQSFVPITIDCTPATLTKAEKWYEIPDRRSHFRIRIHGRIDPKPNLVKGERLGKASRRINHVLKDALTKDEGNHSAC